MPAVKQEPHSSPLRASANAVRESARTGKVRIGVRRVKREVNTTRLSATYVGPRGSRSIGAARQRARRAARSPEQAKKEAAYMKRYYQTRRDKFRAYGRARHRNRTPEERARALGSQRRHRERRKLAMQNPTPELLAKLQRERDRKRELASTPRALAIKRAYNRQYSQMRRQQALAGIRAPPPSEQRRAAKRALKRSRVKRESSKVSAKSAVKLEPTERSAQSDALRNERFDALLPPTVKREPDAIVRTRALLAMPLPRAPAAMSLPCAALADDSERNVATMSDSSHSLSAIAPKSRVTMRVTAPARVRRLPPAPLGWEWRGCVLRKLADRNARHETQRASASVAQESAREWSCAQCGGWKFASRDALRVHAQSEHPSESTSRASESVSAALQLHVSHGELVEVQAL